MNQNNKALEHTLRRYQTALAYQAYGIALLSEDNRVELVNQVFCDLFGLTVSPNELAGLTSAEFLKMLSPAYADPEKTLVRVNNVLAAGLNCIGDEVIMADGRVFLVDFTPIIIDGKPSGRMWQHRDITERKQTEALLAAERQRLAYILESTDVGTWEWNIKTGETIFDERWADIIGYSLAELAPISIDTWFKFTHPDDLEMLRNLLEKHFNKELPYHVSETRMRHKDGSWIWALDRGKVWTWTDDGKPLMMYGTHRDITERKLAEEKIIHLATHDVLTGLPSLRLAKDHLSLALGWARRHNNLAAVMFVDLDNFKAVNDTLGHDAGDYVLTIVADRLLACVRETDTVARVGGDEFLIIATALHSADNAREIAEKVISLVSQPIAVHGQQTIISSSIGIALYPDNSEDPNRLVNLADQSMYQIKNSGKNGFCFAKTEIQ
jgi:diguanylate cyclase (GGDEF)-like protein/PAS domain S-box-containing protein